MPTSSSIWRLPVMPSRFSTSTSTGRPWVSQPARRATRKPAHGAEAAEEVLVDPGPHVVQPRPAVGRRRPLVEDPGLGPLRAAPPTARTPGARASGPAPPPRARRSRRRRGRGGTRDLLVGRVGRGRTAAGRPAETRGWRPTPPPGWPTGGAGRGVGAVTLRPPAAQSASSTSSSEPRTASAMANAGRSRSVASGTATQAMRAALAASTPAGASSQTRQRSGATPSLAGGGEEDPGMRLAVGLVLGRVDQRRTRRPGSKWSSTRSDEPVLATRRRRPGGGRGSGTARCARWTPGCSSPWATTRSMTRSTTVTATSSGSGPPTGSARTSSG